MPASVDGSVPEQRVAAQAARLTGSGAIAGWAALRLHGATYFDGLGADGRTPLPVPLIVGSGKIRAAAAVSLSFERLIEAEVVELQGLRCATPLRAIFDEMRSARDWRDGVVAADMALAAGVVASDDLATYVTARRSWRCSSQAEAAMRYVSDRSASPGESRMRLLWVVDAGFPEPLVNQEVFDREGRLLGVADLFDPVAGVVGEYDGSDHRSAGQHARDVRRQDGFRRVGLEYVTVTGPDLTSPHAVVERMTAARVEPGSSSRRTHAGRRCRRAGGSAARRTPSRSPSKRCGLS